MKEPITNRPPVLRITFPNSDRFFIIQKLFWGRGIWSFSLIRRGFQFCSGDLRKTPFRSLHASKRLSNKIRSVSLIFILSVVLFSVKHQDTASVQPIWLNVSESLSWDISILWYRWARGSGKGTRTPRYDFRVGDPNDVILPWNDMLLMNRVEFLALNCYHKL